MTLVQAKISWDTKSTNYKRKFDKNKPVKSNFCSSKETIKNTIKEIKKQVTT